jgi:type VI secretion system protein ImpC
MEIDRLSVGLDTTIQDQIQQVLHSPSFQRLEASWRSLQDIAAEVNSNEVIVDFLDIDKATLGQDLQDHSAYILNSALFRKVYVEEYDRYGGRPFGVMIGLYDFDSGEEDVEWLETMSHVAAATHCPFVAAIRPQFFGVDNWADLERKDDLETLLSMPQFGRWDAFRSTDHAADIGLTLPRYLLRAPYDAATGKSKFVSFEEKIANPETDYLWGNAAVLFARNMVRSFESSGWCQHVVGPRGGGLIRGLPVHMVMHHGHLELQPPVEIAIPDYRELQFANTGFMSLIHCKGTADATFFSARSIKKATEFEEELSTKNADLVCYLDYTLSVTRIAHYVKRMVRDYIGSTADAPYIQEMLEKWLIEYVTTAVNPDDLTLLYYPFKAMSVSVIPKPGPFGWYNCTVSVLPHIKFQGMDVELRLEAALGGTA